MKFFLLVIAWVLAAVAGLLVKAATGSEALGFGTLFALISLEMAIVAASRYLVDALEK